MRTAIFRGPGSVEIAERPDSVIVYPIDADVHAVLSSVCMRAS